MGAQVCLVAIVVRIVSACVESLNMYPAVGTVGFGAPVVETFGAGYGTGIVGGGVGFGAPVVETIGAGYGTGIVGGGLGYGTGIVETVGAPLVGGYGTGVVGGGIGYGAPVVETFAAPAVAAVAAPTVQTVEKVVEVPQVMMQEVVRQVPRIMTQEVVKNVPVPQLQTIEKVVEVPQVQTFETIVPVPQVQIQEVVRRDVWCWLWHRNWLWRTIFCHSSTRWIDFGRVAHDDYGSSYRVHGGPYRYYWIACRRRWLRLSIYSLVVKATYESSCYRLSTSFVILCSGFIQSISSSLLKKK